MADQLTFNDSLNLLGSLGTGLTTLGGTVNITYGTTNIVTGSLTLTAAGLLTAQTYTNLVLAQTGTTAGGVAIYTLTGSNTLTNVVITYTGQLPNAASSTVNLLSTGLSVASGVGNVVSAIVCFAEGTLIRTPRGDVAIETLQVGDAILTAKGETRAIKWLSSRTVDCRRHPQPVSAMPIKIAAGAFGPDAPYSDLFVSPGHAICVAVVDEVLIPASSLINGSTIEQIDVEEITYWHVELESHDIILANGLPTESYIDVGNRGFFRIAWADIDPNRAIATLENYCRPFVTDESLVRAVRSRLRARAFALGWSLIESTGISVQVDVDGQILQADVDGMTARFVLPATAQDVWLVSDTSVPAGVSDTEDTRSLGVYLRALSIDDGVTERRSISLHDPRLGSGFYAPEGVPGDGHRWTGARARLPAILWEGCRGAFFLRVDLASYGLPRWVAPAEPVAWVAPSASMANPRLRVIKASHYPGGLRMAQDETAARAS
jgi:hypothetical protein